MAKNREEKALREFKEIINDLLYLLRKSTSAETVYMHWVNRARDQFVLEGHSTSLSVAMFKDRIEFQDFFLNPYRDLKKMIQLRVGEQLEAEQLDHYYGDHPIRHLSVVPFINKGETVALAVIESSGPLEGSMVEGAASAYRNALGNVLNTYLEMIELYNQQQEWEQYEESLALFSPRQHKVEILNRMLNEISSLLPSGGASLVARGMDVWVNVLNSKDSAGAPELGLMVDEKSIAHDALKQGRPEFAIHFNQSPKRISTIESSTEGATLAIPLMIDDRRHGVVLAYDQNALTFKESVKHKLINLVRVAALSIRAHMGKIEVEENLLTSEYGNFIPDLWERAIESIAEHENPPYSSWFGFVTVDNVQTLRSKYRLEDLKRLQRTLVTILNPSRFGLNGYIGFNSDYVYSFLLQDSSEDAPERWIRQMNQLLADPVDLSDGQKYDLEIVTGYIELTGEDKDSHTVVQKAKKVLSDAVKRSAAI